jgi:hypothetical protein
MFRKSLLLAAGFLLTATLASAQTTPDAAAAPAPGPGMAGPPVILPLPVIPVGNHYVCYPVKATTPFQPLQAVFRDQFGNLPVTVMGYTRLCNPAMKNYKDHTYQMVNPALHLTCYAIKAVHFVVRQVRTTDQFGTRILVVYPPNEVCLPAAKTLLGPPPKD